MSHTRRILGLSRSLLIYHAIPGRQRRLRRLYRRFVEKGDLVFDLGAHVGNRTRAFKALGCRVVALDPHPDCARLLRILYAGTDHVDVVEAAATSTLGYTGLSISERYPTLTTTNDKWRDNRSNEALFDDIIWNTPISIKTTTLDALIERYGTPSFVKIDVEGAEPSVFAGLSQPLSACSFEYLPYCLDDVRKCVNHLNSLGCYRFNWSPGETYEFGSTTWMSGPQLQEMLESATAKRQSGDVYAQLERR